MSKSLAISEPPPSRYPNGHLGDRLQRGEREIGELLHQADELEREITTWLEPCLELRRRELEELEWKLEGVLPETRQEPLDRASCEGHGESSGVAVVIVCRDQGRWIEEALASVLAQSLPPSEVVLVDDGSTDLQTRHLLARLGQDGYRILTMPEPNGAAARNAGIRSTGLPLYAAFDADARLEPTCLERAAAVLEGNAGLDWVTWDVLRERGGAARRPEPASFAGVLSSAGARAASLTRRRAWEATGGYDEALGVYEETDHLARALELGFGGARLGEPLLDFPLRSDSTGRGVDPAAHVSGMRRLLEKHAATLELQGDEVLAERGRFLDRLRRRVHRLGEAKHRMESDLERISARAESLRKELRQADRQPIDWGDLRRTTPLSHFWGVDRGQPVDRVYVEDFLDRHRTDVRGRVVEIHDAGYTEAFGDGRVEVSDVIDVDAGNSEATLVVDLAHAGAIPGEAFDCFILTQTLNVIYDVREAARHACRILKPGGVLLCTVSALNRVTFGPGGLDGDYWRFTEASLRRLFAELSPLDAFEITTYGNVLACVAFLYGMTASELEEEELLETDPYFPLIYGVRLVKTPVAGGGGGEGDDLGGRLEAARSAWLEAMEPYRDGPGCVTLPTDEPRLTPRHLEGCRVLPDRANLIGEMRPGGVAAEVGVQAGHFSHVILDGCRPRKLHLVDHDLASYGIDRLFAGEIARGEVELHEGDSATVLSGFPDRYFDFVYIDADHRYEAVKRDIEAAKTKIRDDGYLVFHDYTYWSPTECKPYGVVRAVNELCIAEDWRVEYFVLGDYMYCGVAIRRR